MRSAAWLRAISRMSSATCCRSAAAAQNSIFSWLKKCVAELLVLPQLRHEQLVSFRHIEVRGDWHLAQIAHGCLERAGHRLAIVDVERAAVVEGDPEVVVAAEGVVPRQPVAEHRRVFEQRHHGANHRLVGAEHPLRVDHPFWPTGRSRREENLGDRCPASRSRARLPRRWSPASPADRRSASRRSSFSGSAGHDLRAAAEMSQRPLERRPLAGEDEPWLQRLPQRAQGRVVAREQ